MDNPRSFSATGGVGVLTAAARLAAAGFFATAGFFRGALAGAAGFFGGGCGGCCCGLGFPADFFSGIALAIVTSLRRSDLLLHCLLHERDLRFLRFSVVSESAFLRSLRLLRLLQVWHYADMRTVLVIAALIAPVLVSAQTSKPAPAEQVKQVTITLDGEPPVSATSTQTTMTSELFEVLPFESRFAFAALLLAPGVNPNSFSAYGSGGESSNAYLLDRATMNDPETGGTWVFANYHWISRLKTVGLAADAEYGGFTGVVADVELRSGTSTRHALFETLFQNDSLRDSNISDTSSPQLTPDKTDYTTDTAIQFGGPVKRDRAWFFAGAEYYRPKSTPSGFPAPVPTGYNTSNGPTAHLESSPRFIFKPTVRPSEKSTIEGFIEADWFNAEAHDAAANVAPEATLRQRSPEAAWKGGYQRVLSERAFLDVAYSGFRGSFTLTPYHGDTPGWYDADEDYYAVNAFYHYKADRIRHQVAARLWREYRDRHGIKAGLEFERGSASSVYGYNGGKLIEASFGRPYFAYLYDGYSKDDTNTRISAFVQDEWKAGEHFAMNPGVRFDRITGLNKHLGDQVFATNSVAPRIGLVWTLGDTTVRGHYGWYFDAARTSYFDLVDPQINPIYGVDIDSSLNPISAPLVDTPGKNHAIDGRLQQPRLQQATLGVERRLLGVEVALTGIYRRTDHFIDDVLQFAAADFTTVVVADPGPDGARGNSDDTANTATLYRQTTNPLNNQYLISNPDGAFRRYEGVQITASRSTDVWQLHASYVLSRTTGNYDNLSNAGNDPAEYNDPNTDPRYQPLRRGRLTYDNTHLAKAMGAWRGPFKLLFSGVFYYTSGDTFTRTLRTTTTQTPQGRKDVFIEPRGASRYEAQPRLDARVERRFDLGGGALGVILEAFNVTNDAAVTAQTARSGVLYGTPQAVVPARRLRVGATYRF